MAEGQRGDIALSFPFFGLIVRILVVTVFVAGRSVLFSIELRSSTLLTCGTNGRDDEKQAIPKVRFSPLPGSVLCWAAFPIFAVF